MQDTESGVGEAFEEYAATFEVEPLIEENEIFSEIEPEDGFEGDFDLDIELSDEIKIPQKKRGDPKRRLKTLKRLL